MSENGNVLVQEVYLYIKDSVHTILKGSIKHFQIVLALFKLREIKIKSKLYCRKILYYVILEN